VLARGAEAGVLGLVAENLSPPAELEKAVAAALDTRLQAVVVTDLDRAAAAAGLLRAQGRGRGAFVAADARSTALPSAPRGPGRPRSSRRSPRGTGPCCGPPRGRAPRGRPRGGTRARALRSMDGVHGDPPRGTESTGRPGSRVGMAAPTLPPLSRRREIRELSAAGERLEVESTTSREAAASHRNAAAEARDASGDARRGALQDGEIRRAEARKDAARFEGGPSPRHTTQRPTRRRPRRPPHGCARSRGAGPQARPRARRGGCRQ
jgi:hypothetical protein